MEVPESIRREIEKAIHSAESPVGIDAKKTHVIIIHMLKEIDQRLQRVEAALQE